jgi:threonyl-tRNA synthetase
MSTIQVDFQLPQRFDLEYQASDGSRQRPVMIHRALFGSIERFFGVLTEHYAGAFPPWLAPVQVRGIPVAEAFSPYLEEIISRLKKSGVRAEIDASDDRMQKKIRNAQAEKIPFMLIAGEEDQLPPRLKKSQKQLRAESKFDGSWHSRSMVQAVGATSNGLSFW